jgi:uncharacterized membrane protein YjfL (UPF0719 family)
MPDAPANIYWHAPVLLVTFSLVYAATRHDRWDKILWEAGDWVVRIGGFLLTVAVALYVFSSHPDSWPYLAAVAAVLAGGYYYLVGRK